VILLSYKCPVQDVHHWTLQSDSLISLVCGGREWSNSGSDASYDDMALKPIGMWSQRRDTESINENKIIKGEVGRLA